MVNYECHGHCAEWKNMIYFIPNIPRYALADACVVCQPLWFPKFCLLRCPCCKSLLRHGRSRYKKGMVKYRDMPKQPIVETIKKYQSEGWTILKEDIWKRVLEYRILNKMDLQ